MTATAAPALTHGIIVENADGTPRRSYESNFVVAHVATDRDTPFATTREDAERRAAEVNAMEARRKARGDSPRTLIRWRAAPLWNAPVVTETEYYPAEAGVRRPFVFETGDSEIRIYRDGRCFATAQRRRAYANGAAWTIYTTDGARFSTADTAAGARFKLRRAAEAFEARTALDALIDEHAA